MDKSPARQFSGEAIQIKVLFFGAARDVVGQEKLELEVRKSPPASEVFEEILEKFPELRRFGRSLLFAVNQEYARPDRMIQAGDELAVFPPVSGGASAAPEAEDNDFFELTTEPIDVGEVSRRVVLAHCGATVSLDGYAREWTHGRRTVHLFYEAYAPMALREMQRLGREAHQLFEIAHIGIVHRTGRLEIGETSVVIAVSAPHRRAAFDACQWAIQELKRTVPIWKKEVFEDGEIWVEGETSGQ
ncbi:MAG TPA: molybdopterin converting factor subunit 1 [Pyrinomonadaceae bacterium]|nr:molybdopterin converting factor subunit 1 [Pyrinomonadaceae bacterium]